MADRIICIIFTVLAFLILFNTDSYAEEPDLFPLRIGNTWTYRQEYWKYDFDKEDYVKDWEKYITISTIDTITFDNQTYYLFNDGNAYRKEDLFVYKYKLDWSKAGLMYDFTPCDDKCSEGYFGLRYDYNNEFQSCFVTRYNIDYQVPFGIFEGFLFSLGCDTHIIENYHISVKDIGLIYRSDGLYEYYIIKEWLVYARVNGVEYGTTQVGEIPKPLLTVENYPNPFNLSTTITFSLPSSGFASLVIYNIMGQEVRELIHTTDTMAPGNHAVSWDGRDNSGSAVSSGIYISRLRMGDHTVAGRMLLIK